MKLYTHRHTIVYLDYGSELGRENGLSWSTSGKAQDAFGFERGEYAAILASKDLDGAEKAGIELLEGEPVTRKSDINPHGLV